LLIALVVGVVTSTHKAQQFEAAARSVPRRDVGEEFLQTA
jgi:hypothetical protein